MAAHFYSGIAIDQPAGTSQRNPQAADSWLEPWLNKHWGFYRKHISKDGMGMSHSDRRNSVISDGLRSRESSISAPQQVSESGIPHGEPDVHPVKGLSNTTEVKGSRRSSSESSTKKDKILHEWRSNLWKLPHP
jgi:hypothetical protein